MSDKRIQKIRQVLDTRQPDLTVMIENVIKPHNLAAIARTCDAVGIAEIHAVSETERLRLSQQAAGGIRKWIKLTKHKTTKDAYQVLKQKGYNIVVTHLSDDTQDYETIDFTKPTAIVAGSENDGVSDYAIEQADKVIAIPMTGMVQSLNVSVAMSIILYEAMKQRRQAGMYESVQLDPETYQQRLFEWSHPQVSRYCQENNLSYPDMNENGEIINFRRQQIKK